MSEQQQQSSCLQPTSASTTGQKVNLQRMEQRSHQVNGGTKKSRSKADSADPSSERMRRPTSPNSLNSQQSSRAAGSTASSSQQKVRSNHGSQIVSQSDSNTQQALNGIESKETLSSLNKRVNQRIGSASNHNRKAAKDSCDPPSEGSISRPLRTGTLTIRSKEKVNLNQTIARNRPHLPKSSLMDAKNPNGAECKSSSSSGDVVLNPDSASDDINANIQTTESTTESTTKSNAKSLLKKTSSIPKLNGSNYSLQPSSSSSKVDKDVQIISRDRTPSSTSIPVAVHSANVTPVHRAKERHQIIDQKPPTGQSSSHHLQTSSSTSHANQPKNKSIEALSSEAASSRTSSAAGTKSRKAKSNMGDVQSKADKQEKPSRSTKGSQAAIAAQAAADAAELLLKEKEAEIRDLNGKVIELKQLLEKEEKENSEKQAVIESMSEAVCEKECDLLDHQRKIRELEELFISGQEKEVELLQLNESKDQIIQDKSCELREERNRIIELENIIKSDKDKRVRGLREQIKNLQNDVSSLNAVIEMKDEKIRSLNLQVMEFEESLKELPSLKQSYDVLKQKFEQVMISVERKDEKIKRLIFENETFKSQIESTAKMSKRLSMRNEELEFALSESSFVSGRIGSPLTTCSATGTPIAKSKSHSHVKSTHRKPQKSASGLITSKSMVNADAIGFDPSDESNEAESSSGTSLGDDVNQNRRPTSSNSGPSSSSSNHNSSSASRDKQPTPPPVFISSSFSTGHVSAAVGAEDGSQSSWIGTPFPTPREKFRERHLKKMKEKLMSAHKIDQTPYDHPSKERHDQASDEPSSESGVLTSSSSSTPTPVGRKTRSKSESECLVSGGRDHFLELHMNRMRGLEADNSLTEVRTPDKLVMGEDDLCDLSIENQTFTAEELASDLEKDVSLDSH